MMRVLVLPVALFATSAAALEPLPPCFAEGESNMAVSQLGVLPGTGFVTESYTNSIVIELDLGRPLPGPIPELDDFSGVRAVNCATGEMIAARTEDDGNAFIGKLATAPGMAKRIAAEKPIRTRTMRQAMHHLYGNAMLLVEDEETCGCNAVFPELRPAGMTPFDQRKIN